MAAISSRRTHQAVNPHGLGGLLMGALMSRLNEAQNEATLRALALPEGAHVLELGFGPGEALAALLGRPGVAYVAGADHSELMVRRAERRFGRAIEEGRAAVHSADVANLPFADAAFDAVFAVNNFHQWPDQEKALGEIARVLKPDGKVLLSVRVFHEDAKWESRARGLGHAARAVDALKLAGFATVSRTDVPLKGRDAVLVTGTRPHVG